MYTAVNNDGQVHREFLSYPELAPHISTDQRLPIKLATSLAATSKMKGPTQYYSKLCKSNPEALKTLLSNRKLGWPTNQYTGFTVRYAAFQLSKICCHPYVMPAIGSASSSYQPVRICHENQASVDCPMELRKL